MANNYAQYTVQPFVPKNLVTDIELMFLGACGLNNEEYGDEYYLYAEDFLDISGESAYDVIDLLDDQVPSDWDVFSILQAIIARSQSTDNPINYFEIEGAYTCQKMRPGEFGGYCALITADNVQEGGTYSLLRDFKQKANVI